MKNLIKYVKFHAFFSFFMFFHSIPMFSGGWWQFNFKGKIHFGVKTISSQMHWRNWSNVNFIVASRVRSRVNIEWRFYILNLEFEVMKEPLLRPSSQKISIKRVRYLWNTHSVIFDYLMGANYWSSVNKEKILDPVKYSVSTFRFLSATGSRNNQSPISDGIMMFVHLLTYPSLLLFERYVVWFW